MISERDFRRCIAHLTAPQSGSGHLVGIVIDPTWALISMAPMILRNTKTGMIQAGISSVVGEFKFLDLVAGPYELEISLNMFAQTRVRIEVNSGHVTWLPLVLSVPEQVKIPAALASNPPKETPAKSVSEQLEEARTREDISHEEQAARIGISRTAYFDVKRGAGGRASRRKVTQYLDRLLATAELKSVPKSGLNPD